MEDGFVIDIRTERNLPEKQLEQGTRGEVLVPQWAEDYFAGLLGGGIPSTYHLARAIERGDMEEAIYYAKVEAAVLGTQYGMLQLANMIQGPKYAINFHQLKAGLSFGRSQVLQNPVVIAAASAAAQYQVWKDIGDQKTGATHYLKAGSIGKGSMPTISEQVSWQDIKDWFTRL